jgi:dTDP-4-dehydrorhamnose reductase
LFAQPDYEVVGAYNTRLPNLDNCELIQNDITDLQKTNQIISDFKPDIIINTTALHNVDYCEENKEEAFRVNSSAVKNLRISCDKIGAKLVHISTDYVFDGKNKNPYSEKDLPSPVSIYGESKLSGEKYLKNTNHSVLRPSVVYGWTPMELAGTTSSSGKPMNFAMWLLTKLNNDESVKIVTDQFASATLADSLAESALKIAKDDSSGIFHVAGLSCESRFEFSQKLAKEFGYDQNLIQPTDSSQFKQKAKRPLYSCLDCTKAIKTFDLNLRTTEDSLKIMKNQVEKEAPHLMGS